VEAKLSPQIAVLRVLTLVSKNRKAINRRLQNIMPHEIHIKPAIRYHPQSYD